LIKTIVEKVILNLKTKINLPLEFLLKHTGISQRTWRAWMRRREIERKHNNNIFKNYYLTLEEERAIAAYIIANLLKGYRVLCYEMIDKNIAFVGCTSIYNVIKRYNLGKKWAEARETGAVSHVIKNRTCKEVSVFTLSRCLHQDGAMDRKL